MFFKYVRKNLSKKRVTSKDVAKLAGVSRSTVSFVLNDVKGIKISNDTRIKVKDAADELGYVPDAAAQALASRRSRIIGLILTRKPHHIASDAFITQILDGVLEIVHKNDLRLLVDIVEPEHQEEAYTEMVRAKRIDGILLSGPRFDDDALMVLGEEGFPTVLIGQLPGPTFYSVDVDNFSAAKNAVEHLVRLGHTRIVCITNAPQYFTAASDRLKGYQQALTASGISYDDRLVRFGDFDANSGYLQMKSMLERKVKFTAAFVASDSVALGAMAAIREQGLRIPKDIALVGFDDIPIAKFFDPPLTTIHLPAIELGRRAGNLLIKLLKKDHLKQQHVILGTNLVIRESCGYNAKIEGG
jgi:DNA-binding LacI/PurR family transcriptional regulator